MIRLLAVLLMLALAGYLALHLLRGFRRGMLQAQYDVLGEMTRLARGAVHYAAERDVILDYTPRSIEAVDELLGELHELHAEGRMSEGDFDLYAAQFGAYVGEVLRQEFDGHWTKDHEVAGPNSFPLHYRGHASFPLTWCAKRIVNGDEDNIWFKYRVMTSEEHLNATFDDPPDDESAAR